MISWREYKLQQELKMYRNRLKSCLSLIDDLAELETDIFSADKTLQKKFILVVSRAKKALDKKR